MRFTEVQDHEVPETHETAITVLLSSPSVIDHKIYSVTTPLGKPLVLEGSFQASPQRQEREVKGNALIVICNRMGSNGPFPTFHLALPGAAAPLVVLKDGSGCFTGSYPVEQMGEGPRFSEKNGYKNFRPLILTPESSVLVNALAPGLYNLLNETPKLAEDEPINPFTTD